MPYELREALANALHDSFWYWRPFESFMASSVGSRPDRLPAGFTKGPYGKRGAVHLMLDFLDKRGPAGLQAQRDILNAYLELGELPEGGNDEAQSAFKSRQQKVLSVASRLGWAKIKAAPVPESLSQPPSVEQLLNTAKEKYQELTRGVDQTPQRRGLLLEGVLQDLFNISGISCEPFVTTTEQIDGAFVFDSHDYLLEAKWTKDLPSQAVISSLYTKMTLRPGSPRGLFLSVNGFRAEVVSRFDRDPLIFVDGMDLMILLEGRIPLRDALQYKWQQAFRSQNNYASLQDMFI